MKSFTYTITLVSDGEPGTGTGSELVNDFVPRDEKGNPMIPSTHLKGLMRANLDRLDHVDGLKDRAKLLRDVLLGETGSRENHGAGRPGCLHISHARVPARAHDAHSTASTRTITRTAVSDLGVVHGGTLRTTEAIGAGTTLTGTVQLPHDASAGLELAMKYALTSISSIGGGRNRGSGACLVKISTATSPDTMESSTPGAMLRQLVSAQVSETRAEPTLPTTKKSLGDTGTLLRLVFRATDPVCCPEHPIGANNVLRSGIAIPASAVIGAVITLLDRVDSALATATLRHPLTRAWPLLPSPVSAGGAGNTAAVHVSLSHRMSKYSISDAGNQKDYVFKDGAVEPYDVTKVPGNVPLKGTDGVLLVSGDDIKLLKSGMVPRMLSAHAVLRSEKLPDGTEKKNNLFTVEALAPTTFVGWIHLPKEAAEVLQKTLNNQAVTFGKSKTVRGGGTLEVATPKTNEAIESLAKKHRPGRHVFVVQSPIVIPNTPGFESDLSAEKLLEKLLIQSGWGTPLSREADGSVVDVNMLAMTGVRFGWNRHAAFSNRTIGASRRLKAHRVILPGSVFTLSSLASEKSLFELLVQGIGEHREEGYGSVVPHPGFATGVVEPKFEPNMRPKTGDHTRWALDLYDACRGAGPTPSQISGIIQKFRVEAGVLKTDKAAEYFFEQLKRPNRIWERWNPVAGLMTEYFNQAKSSAARAKTLQRALEIWRDLAVAKTSEEN